MQERVHWPAGRSLGSMDWGFVVKTWTGAEQETEQCRAEVIGARVQGTNTVTDED
jgi:hypothetical protein